jgi:phage baseplate assembly protein W
MSPIFQDDLPLQGFAFPFRIKNGGVERAADYAKVEQDIIHLISTRLGERVMLRTYGGSVHHHLEDPNDDSLQTLMGHEIDMALKTFMPDVRLTSPLRFRADDGQLTITIEYSASPADVVRRLQLTI